jgi:hypothetical protein
VYIEEWQLQQILREQAEEELERQILEVLSHRIEFRVIRSEVFSGIPFELQPYDFPLTEIITANSVKDMTQLIDEDLLKGLVLGGGSTDLGDASR